MRKWWIFINKHVKYTIFWQRFLIVILNKIKKWIKRWAFRSEFSEYSEYNTYITLFITYINLFQF